MRLSLARLSLARPIAITALALASAGVLAGCGGGDSTATGTPSSATTASASAGSTTAGTTSPSAQPSVAATAPPEQPQALPSDFPGPTAIPIDANGQAFLAELKKNGVTPAGDGQIAISTANYICAAQAQNASPDEVSTFVTANVGVEASAAGVTLSADQATAMAQTYINAAQATYCKS